MTDSPEGYDYPPEVRFEIPETDISAYRRAVDFLNLINVDVLCLQHEFGIFGCRRPPCADVAGEISACRLVTTIIRFLPRERFGRDPHTGVVY